MRLRKLWTDTLGRRRKDIWTALVVVSWGTTAALFVSEVDGWRPGVPWVQVVAIIASVVTLAGIADRAISRAAFAAVMFERIKNTTRPVIPAPRSAPPPGTTYRVTPGPGTVDVEGPTVSIPTRAGQYQTVEQHKARGALATSPRLDTDQGYWKAYEDVIETVLGPREDDPPEG